MRSAAFLYAALLAVLPQVQPRYCGEQKMPHDQVAPFPEKEPKSFTECAAHKYNPTLHISHGCSPYPAVNIDGMVSGGLKATGKANGNCAGAALGDQVYARSMWKYHHWAIMYAYFFPKDSVVSGKGHRYDWEWVVIWLNNPDVNVSRIEAVSVLGREVERYNFVDIDPKYFADGVPQLEYEAHGDRHFVTLSTDIGRSPDLVVWHEMSDHARCALNKHGWNENELMPMSDDKFEKNLERAWNAKLRSAK
ncbi:unnamed protein product [Hyaloperonospora brassicae]|uniref:Nep1-like protein n=1 Tax=Hyaloperonospora brassicae TaxID=162125 RepID=A0AAV0T0I9_HYABA|nr:unnamed protein product [Hyaloperonospora brassicae]